MTTETMTVHEALCEAKTMEKRIEQAIKAAIVVSHKENQSVKVDGMTLDEFNKHAKSSHDKATHLIDRYNAIKAGINRYNAEKQINVGNRTYSIAQAIWLMQHGLKQKKKLIDHYTYNYNIAMRDIQNENGEKLNKRAEAAAEVNYGNKDKSNNTEDYLKCIKEYKARNQHELVDPLGIKDIIEKMDTEVNEFMSHVDSAIQVANATTTITIEY